MKRAHKVMADLLYIVFIESDHRNIILCVPYVIHLIEIYTHLAVIQRCGIDICSDSIFCLHINTLLYFFLY